MMESIEQKLICVINILIVLIVLSSCQSANKDNQLDMMLECALDNFIVDENLGNHTGSFLVGQHDDWSENKSMIIISYIPDDKTRFINAEEKSKYKKNDIYFYQVNLKVVEGENAFQKIPNNLKWEIFENQYSKNEIQPLFDPATAHLVYNNLERCWEEIIEGKNHMQKNWESICKICKKDYPVFTN